jgi:hypothetical protein
VRLAIRVEAECAILERWSIGKLLRRSRQIGCRRWTIGKMFRRSGQLFFPFPGLPWTNGNWSDEWDGLATT